METSIIDSFDKAHIVCYEWNNVKEPKGVVQIIHGMAEHSLRYDELAKYLNTNGYIVFADDHRGHGATAGSVQNVGVYDKPSNIFEDTLKDEILFSEKLKAKYNLPLIVLGHSYGSIILQKYIQVSNIHNAVVFSGTNYMKGLPYSIAKIIAKTTMKSKGNNAPAALIESLSFGSYNKKIKTGIWIVKNNDEAKKYIDDKYCGATFSAKFYCDFFSSAMLNYNKNKLNKIDKSKPVLFISGAEDLFSNNSKGVLKMQKIYNNLGIQNVNTKIYNNMRHEVLNETDHAIVYFDVLAFLNKQL